MDVPIMRLCDDCIRKLEAHYIVNDRPGVELGACFACVDKTPRPVRVCEVTPRPRQWTRSRPGGGERARAGRR